MGLILLLLFVATTTASLAPETGLRLLFPSPHQYVYDVKTNVSIGTEPKNKKSSLWLLEGTLTLQAYDNFTKARLQLDIRKKTVIGNTGYFYLYGVEGDKFFKNPWEVDYQENGFIKSIYHAADEPTWSVNFKRAISVNLQLTRAEAKSGTYSISEPCLDDICVMVYTMKGNTIKKYTSYRVPTTRSTYTWGSVPWTSEYTQKPYVDSISSAERVYEMDDQTGLINFDLKGNYQYKTHDHILSVTSDLSLKLKEDKPLARMDKLNLTQTTIQYVAGDFSDPTNGIANSTQMHLTNKSYQILLKIARKGIDADNIVRNASLIHNLDFIELLNTMSQLRYDSLIKLFNDLVLGTSYDMETSRNIFLEILPHVRSDACARFIKYLVLEEKEKVEDAALLSLIRKLPFNIAIHSQQLLEELEVFTKLGLDFASDIRYAGILSFATLLHKTMDARQVKQDYLDNIVVKYFRMYSDCPQYVDRIVWLQGLCNIGYSAASYTRVIHADAGRDQRERLWAALAGGGNPEDQYTILETTLPILMNETEDIQLRIVALHMFLSSPKIRETDFSFVHNYIMSSSNKHLRSFWYSTVKNLAMNRDFTGYQVPSFYIPFVVNQVPSPDPLYWATNNYIISGTEEDGAPSLQLLSVGDSLGAAPSFIGIKLLTGGKRPYKAAVYILVEGVIANILEFKRRYNVDTRDIDSEKLFQLLQSIKTWAVKKREKLHIDIVVKLHDKTVYATHMNQTRFERWNKEDYAYLEDVLLFGSHINQQIVYYPFQTDVHIPTELGTPIRLQSTILSFTSIRGNLTAPSNEDVTWRNDLHIRYQGTAVTSLSTAAPLVETVHIARIQQSLVAHLPMRFNVSLSAAEKSLILTWPNPGDQQAGVAMHSRAEVITETKTEGYDYMLKRGKIQNKKDSIFFDCERPLTGTEVLDKVMASNTKHHEFIHPIQPSLIILNAIVLFSSPPPGSCGVILQPRTTASDDVLEVKVLFDKLDFGTDKIDVVTKFVLKYFSLENPENVFLKVDAAALLQKIQGNLNLGLTLKGHHPNASADSTKDWQVCLKDHEITYPSFAKDISSEPASYEGTMSLSFGTKSCNHSDADSELTVNYKGAPATEEDGVQLRITGRNMSRMGVLDLDLVSQTTWGQLLKAYNEDILNITAAVKESNGLATITMENGSEVQFKLDSFGWLLDRWTDVQMWKNFGLYRECRLKDASIQLLSGDIEDLPTAQCPQDLLLADCKDNTPRFAVFRTRDGITVNSGGFFINLKSVNGETVVNDTNAGDKFLIHSSTNENMTRIATKHTDLLIYYEFEETVILVPRLFVSTVCGLCSATTEYNVC